MHKSITVTVYGLSSSEDGKIRYVGQTTEPLSKRLIHHHYDAKKLTRIHKSNWIRSVIERGFKVQIIPLQEEAPLHAAEIEWIAKLRAQGYDLVNTTNGGEGVFGYRKTPEQLAAWAAKMRGRTSPRKGVTLSEETRAKISAAQIGKEIPVETRMKISAALRGRPKSPEHAAKVAAARRGERRGPLSAEIRAKLSAANLGRKHTPESRARMSTAQTGRTFSAETKALWSLQRTGAVLSTEHKAKIAAGLAKAYADGRRGAQSKLSDDEVREVRALVDAGIPQRDIASAYGLSEGALSELKSGKSYRHVA